VSTFASSTRNFREKSDEEYLILPFNLMISVKMDNEWSNVQPYQDFEKEDLDLVATHVAQLGIIHSDMCRSQKICCKR